MPTQGLAAPYTPADEPVGRSVGDQIIERTAPALGCDHERPVFDERPLVDQVGQILPSRPVAPGVASLDPVRPAVVQTNGMSVDDRPEVAADVIEVHIVDRHRLVALDRCGIDEHEGVTLQDGLADLDDDQSDNTARRRRDDVRH